MMLYIFGFMLFFQSVHSYIEITNLPDSVSVHEDAAGGTFLFTVVAYTTTGSTHTCSLTSASAHFEITGGNTVQLKTDPGLNYSTSTSHVLSITCNDGTSTSVAASLTVNLIQNAAPVYTYTSTSVFGTTHVSAKTTKANNVIFQLSYTDSDSVSPLKCQRILSVTPTPAPTSTPGQDFFSMANDMIRVASDLETYSYEPQYVLEIEVGDEKTTSTGTVSVLIVDRNTAPEFVLSNLTASLTLPEITTVGRLRVYQIAYLDSEDDAITMKDIRQDAGVSTYFDLVPSTGEVYLIGGKVLDYETQSQYVLDVTIEDYLEVNMVQTFTLTISVSDVQERPTFNATPSTIYIDEGNKTQVIGIPDSLCTDPDGTSPSYSILLSTLSSYFAINNSTAQLSFAEDFDYDDVNLANEVNLTIRCYDSAGLSDDKVLTIIIQDINDNYPVCSPSTTSFKLKYNQVVNDTIVNLDCTDADSNDNAVLDYAIIGVSSGYSKTYFQVDAYGNVSIHTAFAMDYNTSFYVTILVTDRGSTSLSFTETLTITYTEEPIVIVYEEVKECFLCTTSALTLLSVAGLATCMLVTCCVVIIVLRCCYDIERRKIEDTLTKKKKRRWRLCGCLRPGERKKVKKTKKEIVLAENRDLEYMRARNALLGLDDQPTASHSLLSTDLPGPSTSKGRRHDRKPLSGSAGTSGGQNVALLGRDKTPDISATPVDKMKLTESQKIQLKKFEDMKRSTAGGNGPSSSKTGQAASGMVWAFDRR